VNKNKDRDKCTTINLIMGVWYITYNLGLPKKSYLLKISEGIHDEGAMKSGSSGFFRYELCVMAKFFNCGFIARWGQ